MNAREKAIEMAKREKIKGINFAYRNPKQQDFWNIFILLYLSRECHELTHAYQKASEYAQERLGKIPIISEVEYQLFIASLDVVDAIEIHINANNMTNDLLEKARAEIVELRKVVDKTLFNAKAQKHEGGE